MPIVVAAEVFRLVMTQRYGTGPLVQNVFHVGNESTGTSVTAIATDFRDNVITPLKPNFTGAINYLECSCQRIAPTESEIVRLALTGTGTNPAGLALPTVACGITTWRTQLTGRSRRGRTYWSGLPYDFSGTSDGFGWLTPGLTRLNNISNFVLTHWTLGGNPQGSFMVIWSRKLGGATPPRNPTTGAAMVTTFTSQRYIASMGTRRLGHGL